MHGPINISILHHSSYLLSLPRALHISNYVMNLTKIIRYVMFPKLLRDQLITVQT